MKKEQFDAVVVGSGPNGLAAAIALVAKGLSVLIVEEKDEIGGGCRSEELTDPGFIHDVCSSIYPLGVGSPFFRELPLADFGLEWIHPPAPFAHPHDDGSCTVLERSLEQTCRGLGEDSSAYRDLFFPFTENWSKLENTLLGPLTFPSHLFLTLRFACKALQSAEGLIKRHFHNQKTKALFAGLAAHSILPLDQAITAAIGMVLGITGHVYGWPMPKGGARNLSKALGLYFQSLGGEIRTGFGVSDLKELPPSRTVIFDLTPRQILQIAGDQFSSFYQNQLRKYRYGSGVYKIDWALSEPIPWKAKECFRAGTIHVGGTFDQIAAGEKEVAEGKHPERPFVLLAQHSLFDVTRAPRGKHTAWGYCHVPHNSMKDMSEKIESQIERFAPGFKDCIIKKSTKNTAEITQYNSNYIGGDIVGGVQDIRQLFTRPVKRLVPYATSNPHLFICSSSTPPGGGVHGMCGYHAARVVLKRVFGKTI